MEIEGIIDNLYRITVTALKPVSAMLESGAISNILRDEEDNDVSRAFGAYVLELLSHRYSRSSDETKQRLANSIIRRRRILLYRQEYHDKMRPVISLGSPHIDEHETQASTTFSVQHSDKATNDSQDSQDEDDLLGIDQMGLKEDGPSGQGTGIIPPYPDDQFDSALDAASVTTTATTASGYHERVKEIPPPPSMHGREVECPYCFGIILWKDTTGNRWK